MKITQKTLVKASFYGAFAWLFLSNFFDKELFLPVLYIFVLLSVFALILEYVKNYMIAKKYDGTVRFNYAKPTPFMSIMRSLDKLGYKVADVKSLKLVSNDLNETCSYLEKHSSIQNILTDLTASGTNIKIIGMSENSNCNELKEKRSIKFKKVQGVTTEHHNLIETSDGKKYLWYEPEHIIRDGKHYFSDGAYFIEISIKKFTEINQELDELKASA